MLLKPTVLSLSTPPNGMLWSFVSLNPTLLLTPVYASDSDHLVGYTVP